MNACAECGGPVFADVMRGGVGVPVCQVHFDVCPAPTLPDKFSALVDGRTDDGTPTEQPKTFMLDRKQTERLIRAARSVCNGGPVDELKAVLASIRIDA